ncbi:MAG: TRAP transporter small permease subunit [Bacteroidetes bacterium]|nr:TRAP transporter small permease subunit [Bacteroidota bacterium]
MLDQVIQFIHRINDFVGRVASWFAGLLVLLVFFNVIYRYALSENLNWLKELEWHFFGLIFLFGAGYTLRRDQHVRVDLFYERFSRKDKALLNFWGALLFLIPWCLLLIITSWNYALESFFIREGSPEPGGIPAWYPIKFAVPVGLFFLLLQAIALLLESWQKMKYDKLRRLKNDD